MQLFVIRHGVAEPAGPDQEDATRALTAEGRRKLRQAVKGLRSLDIAFKRVLTSPWTRAEQTATVLAPITIQRPVATELLCQAPTAALLTLIAADPGRTAVVGHEPWLTDLISWLAFGDSRHGEAFNLKKGGVVWLDGMPVPGGMSLRAMLPPRFVRAAR